MKKQPIEQEGIFANNSGFKEHTVCFDNFDLRCIDDTGYVEGDDDEQIDYKLNFTFNKAQKREVRAALSNTFGFGGHNSCIIFKKCID